jgi:two-component system phosphate regulon sensor histidine kinase PhoR
MELSRFTVRILIVLLMISLGGILYLQFRVVRNNLEMKEEAFGRNVVSALNYAAERIEEIDVRERFFKAAGDSIEGPVAVRVENMHASASEEGGDSKMFVSVVTAGRSGLATRFNGERLSYDLDNPQRVAVKILDVFGKLDTTMIDEIKDAGTYHVVLPPSRLERGIFFVRVETDSATSTLRWDRDGGGWSQNNTDAEGRARRIIGRVAETVSSGGSRELSEMLSPGLLDSLLTEGLARNGIRMPFDYAVRDIGSDSLVLTRLGTDTDSAQFQFSTVLFPLGFSGAPGEILVLFPGYRSHLLGTLLPELIINIILVGILIACFWYAIRMLSRQKEFAGRLSDFINNMTHEFKTPLSTIALSTEAIARPDVSTDAGRVETYNTIISDEQKRMKSQVDRILQMAALEEGELEFKLTELDIHEIIRRAGVNISLRVAERGGTLVTSLHAAKALMRGDAVHVENVIHNLLDNANKYSPETPAIEVSTRNEGNVIVVAVSDRGIGLANDQREKIWEKYYRVPTRNIHDVKGFGLGLSYVRLVVEKHGGKVRATGREGRGTVIEITFPVSDG